jgi:[pyruvate, water dikinase]-phosphate phosphotransferase / [pyruvate, water dikinase] kinase
MSNDIKTINIHFVSDSSGETVLHVGNAVLAQFENIEINKLIWPMVRSKSQVDNLIEGIKEFPGIVLYTMVDDKLIKYMRAKCDKFGTIAVSVIDRLVDDFSKYLGIKHTRHIAGWQHNSLSDSYFKKIEALNFAITHDDGQMFETISNSDIVIFGVSRTSKSPTSLYLAQRGYMISNMPIVKDIEMPVDISTLSGSLSVGLTILPERLRQIRTTRFQSMGSKIGEENQYIDIDIIKEEILLAHKFYSLHKMPVIDVTGKAIEETSAEILNLYFKKVGGHLTRE